MQCREILKKTSLSPSDTEVDEASVQPPTFGVAPSPGDTYRATGEKADRGQACSPAVPASPATQNIIKLLGDVSPPPCGAPLDVLVQNYLSNYGIKMSVSPASLQHLRSLQANFVVTSESSARLTSAPKEKLHVEVRRSLTRLNCLNLLVEGSERAYLAFVAHQPHATALSRDSFGRLAKIIVSLSPTARSVIEASCVVAISEEALQAARSHSPQTSFSSDSEKFLSQVVTSCPSILPIWSELSAPARILLPAAYPADTHARHMLYTEGGNNMFAVLRALVASGELTDEQFGVWQGRWIANIAGFRGHEDPQGSIYFNEHTAQALFLLFAELEHLRADPKHDVLQAYLAGRARVLGIDRGLYLAHLASMMRLYTPIDAQALKDWFAQLPTDKQMRLEESYAVHRSSLAVTPTYEPALLDNLQALGCTSGESANLHSGLVQEAQALYSSAIQTGRVVKSTPLCFRELAFAGTLQTILNASRDTVKRPTLRLRDDGMCVLDTADSSTKCNAS
jgi:hypothetical protein